MSRAARAGIGVPEILVVIRATEPWRCGKDASGAFKNTFTHMLGMSLGQVAYRTLHPYHRCSLPEDVLTEHEDWRPVGTEYDIWVVVKPIKCLSLDINRHDAEPALRAAVDHLVPDFAESARCEKPPNVLVSLEFRDGPSRLHSRTRTA